MSHSSLYDTEQIENILNDILNVLQKHNATAGLSLIVLGNLITNIINEDVTPSHREAIASSFAKSLFASIHNEELH